MTTLPGPPIVGTYAERIAYPTSVLVAGQWWIQTDHASNSAAGNYQWNGLSWALEDANTVNSAALADSRTTFLDSHGVSVIIPYLNYETVQAYKFILGEKIYSSFAAYQTGEFNFARLEAFPIVGHDSLVHVIAISPNGRESTVYLYAGDETPGEVSTIRLRTGILTSELVITNRKTYINSTEEVRFALGKLIVDANGDITTLKNIAYSWPSTQGVAGSDLENGGTGTLIWRSPVRFVIRHSANQSIADNSSIIPQFDTNDVDLDNMHYASSAALTGTVAKTNGSAVLVGTGTLFTSELSVGQVISVPGTAAEIRVVTVITDDLNLTVSANYANTASGQTATRDNRYVACRTAGTYILGMGGQFAFNTAGSREAFIRKRTGQDVITTLVPYSGRAVADYSTYFSICTEEVSLAQWDIVECRTDIASAGAAVNLSGGTTYSPKFWGVRIGA